MVLEVGMIKSMSDVEILDSVSSLLVHLRFSQRFSKLGGDTEGEIVVGNECWY